MYHVYITDGSDDPDCTVVVSSHETFAEADEARERQQEECNRRTGGEFGAFVRNDAGIDVMSVKEWLKAPDDVPLLGFDFPTEVSHV